MEQRNSSRIQHKAQKDEKYERKILAASKISVSIYRFPRKNIVLQYLFFCIVSNIIIINLKNWK
jgi:hypothetical protein